MAQAKTDPTRIEFTLDEYHHHIRMVLACGTNDAIREMERRIAIGRSLLICREYDADGNLKGEAHVINRRDFSANWNLKFDTSGLLRVVPRTLRSMFGGIKADPSDPDWPNVRHVSLPKEFDVVDYTIVEQATSPTPTAELPPPRKPVTSSKKTKPTTASKEPGGNVQHSTRQSHAGYGPRKIGIAFVRGSQKGQTSF
jgi:hypothetical protein